MSPSGASASSSCDILGHHIVTNSIPKQGIKYAQKNMKIINDIINN